MAKKTPNPIDKYVGARVRMRLVTLGLSQETVAHSFGLTFQQLQKYEKGANRIGASRLQQLATILQVPVSFFFEGAPGGAAPAGSLAAELLTAFFSIPGTQELAQDFTKLSTVDRRVVLDVARALTNAHLRAAQTKAA